MIILITVALASLVVFSIAATLYFLGLKISINMGCSSHKDLGISFVIYWIAFVVYMQAKVFPDNETIALMSLVSSCGIAAVGSLALTVWGATTWKMK